jgi:hypothetical protein
MPKQRSKSQTKPYDVGYRKPPTQFQFKKARSAIRKELTGKHPHHQN